MSILIRFAISPLFFILGIISYGAERSIGGHLSHAAHMETMDTGTMNMGAMDMSPMVQSVDIYGMSVSSGMAAVLTSMWLMYVLMGLAHVSPWLDFLKGKRVKDF